MSHFSTYYEIESYHKSKEWEGSNDQVPLINFLIDNIKDRKRHVENTVDERCIERDAGYYRFE